MAVRLPEKAQLKYAVAAAALVAAGAVAVFALRGGGPLQANPVLEDGTGYVVTDFAFVLGPDADKTGACPNGMSKTVEQIFHETPEGKKRPGENDDQYSERLRRDSRKLASAPDGRNYCLHPELAPPDPHYRTLDANHVKIEGLDLDGKVSPGDFSGPGGKAGIDNQFFRVVGCSTGYQSTAQANQFDIGMYAGEWGILIHLGDVDDYRNDDSVEVGIFANADPIALSPTREALEYATYALDQDPRFRAMTTGRIKDGVLTTDPVDVRFHSVVNSMHLERPLKDARIRATVSEDGTLKGTLAGYTPVEDMYDVHFGFRNGKNAEGVLAPLGLRLNSANGAAGALGRTCPGVYQAMHRLADGHPDPETGKFTSISTQYRFEAVKAFLVDVETKSGNEALVASNES